MNIPSLTSFVANVRRAGIYIVIYSAMGRRRPAWRIILALPALNMH
jgi:hypothetical protein